MARNWKSWCSRLAVAAALIGLSFWIGSRFFGQPGYRYQGSIVWIDGRSYIEATRTLQEVEKRLRAELAQSLPAVQEPVLPTRPRRVVGRVAAPAAEERRPKLGIGQKLETGGSCRAAMLDDGTPVFLNRDTAVAYESRGELTLVRGEIFLERQLPQSEAAVSKFAENRPAGFVVNLPNGELVAWSASVDLRVEKDRVHVVVVRGTAYLADTPVRAGQSFDYRGDKQLHGRKPAAVAQPLAAIAWTVGHSGEQASGELRSAAPPGGCFSVAPHDLIFLIECSGDRTPREARAQIEIVRTLMNFAAEGSMAALVVAGARPLLLAPHRFDATPETTERMTDMLERLHLVGGLDLEAALDAARPLLAASRNPLLVHIGSGRATLGERDRKTLIERIPAGVRYVGIEIAAAKRAGGDTSAITPDDDIHARVVALLASLDRNEPPANLIVHPAEPVRISWRTKLAKTVRNFVPRGIGFLKELRLKDWRELVLAAGDWRSHRLAEAERRIQKLLGDDRAARCPLVWRMAATVAGEQGRLAAAIDDWEKALAIEAGSHQPAAPADYAWLLGEYGKLARAIAGLPSGASEELVPRVIEAADRWRAVDCDPAAACAAAARVLSDLGAKDEAWQYATTLR